MDYSKILIRIRAKLNLSQNALGRMMGVSFSTINRWENKKAIPSKKHACMLENICEENKIILEVYNNVTD